MHGQDEPAVSALERCPLYGELTVSASGVGIL